MTFEHLHLTEDGPVIWAKLNRPDALNALNAKLIDELLTFFGDLQWRREKRIVVLHGEGRAFCAGLDLTIANEIAEGGAQRSIHEQRRISEIVMRMRRCPQAILALVNGAASGAGFALALASDIRIATTKARMNASFIRLGLGGCDIGVSYFLPRMVGASVAAELMMTGRFLTPERALALGLVSAVVEPEALLDEGRAMLADLLYASPLGLRLTKEALGVSIDAGDLASVIAMEDRNQVLCVQSDAFKEGVAAFIEKRAPNYGEG
jgi:enoyl-CoA hydratase/carnithine racemase